jgi:hypothetical protein
VEVEVGATVAVVGVTVPELAPPVAIAAEPARPVVEPTA